MSRAIRKPDRLNEAMSRLLGRPAISIEDWAELNDVNRNTAFREAAKNQIEGAYRVGNQIRIASVPWRKKLGLIVTQEGPPEQSAAA